MKRHFQNIIIALGLLSFVNNAIGQNIEVEVAAIIDTIQSLENQPNQQLKYVSEISHLYLESHSHQLYPYVKNAFDKSKNTEDLPLKFDMYHLMEAVFYATSEFDKAAPIAFYLLKIAEQTKDSIHYYFAYSSIAADEAEIGSFYKAMELQLEAHKYAKTNTSLLAKSHIELGYGYSVLENYSKAKKHLMKGVELAQKDGRVLRIMYSFSELAEFYYQTEEYDKALTYVSKVDSLARVNKRLGDSRDILNINMTAGAIYQAKKDTENALKHYNNAMKLAQAAGDLNGQLNIYESLAELEEARSNYPASLNNLKKYSAIKDSIYTTTSSKQINMLKVVYEVEKKDIALANAEVNEKAAKSQRYYSLLIATFVSISLVLLILYFRYKWKTSKITAELNLKENKIHQIEIENLESEVQLKNKELADIFLHQYEKAQLLTNVIENIDQSNERLKTNLQDQLNKSDDWNNFKLHFDKVHEGFFLKLNKLASNLTSKNIRYCAYLRMNLTSKEIAIMLGISYRTVQGIRGRVRKKLDLTSSEDLVLFLMNL